MTLPTADWRLPWNGEIYSVDLSSFGYGICASGWPSERVADVARVSERSRFKRTRGGPSAHEHALKLCHADPFSEPLTALSPMPDIDGALDADWTIDTSFPNLVATGCARSFGTQYIATAGITPTPFTSMGQDPRCGLYGVRHPFSLGVPNAV